jgi:hypothetical protein
MPNVVAGLKRARERFDLAAFRVLRSPKSRRQRASKCGGKEVLCVEDLHNLTVSEATSFWKLASFRSESNIGSSRRSAGVSGTPTAVELSYGIESSFSKAAMARSGSPFPAGLQSASRGFRLCVRGFGKKPRIVGVRPVFGGNLRHVLGPSLSLSGVGGQTCLVEIHKPAALRGDFRHE